MKRRLIVTTLGCLLSTVTACDLGPAAPEETVDERIQLLEDITANLPRARIDIEFVAQPVLQKFQLNLCPNGEDLTVLSHQVCFEPVLYSCSYYYCGNSLSPLVNPNPQCKQAAMQTTDCTNTVPEIDDYEFEYWVDPFGLHERVPTLFSEEFGKWDPPAL